MGVANRFGEVASEWNELLIELRQLFFFQFLKIIQVKLIFEAREIGLLLFNFLFFHHAAS